jgi:hypothetical protein
MKLVFLPFLAVLVGCTSSITTVTATIGAGGGTLTSSDGNVTIAIPAGALTDSTQISIGGAQSAPTNDQMIGAAYEIGPSGTQFAAPATLAMSNKLRAGNLAIATAVNGHWSPLASRVDSMQVTANIDHLSLYELVAIPVDGGGGAGGGGAGGGGAGGGGAGGSTGSGGADMPPDASADRNTAGAGVDGMSEAGAGGTSGAAGSSGGAGGAAGAAGSTGAGQGGVGGVGGGAGSTIGLVDASVG